MAAKLQELPDLYAILGVDSTATLPQIKSAYRKLAHAYHPDVSQEVGTEEKFKEVSAAYEVLKDARKRAGYDASRPQYPTAPRPPRPDPEEETAPPVARRNESERADVRVNVVLTYAEAISGVTKKVNYKRREPCTVCNGRPNPGRPCRVCWDVGRVDAVRWHMWTIAPGAATGTSMRVEGAGDRLPNKTGDLLMTVMLQKQVGIERRGTDFHTTRKVPLGILRSGGEVKVEGPSGVLVVRIRPETPPGTVLRLANLGLPFAGGCGALFVTLKGAH